MYKFLSSKVTGSILLAVIIGGFCLFIYKSGQKIDYIWRWNRVPSYIINTEPVNYTARSNGVLEIDGRTISVVRPNGTVDFVTDSGSAVKEAGAQVVVGDVIAVDKSWRLGPLAKGLVLTVQISFYSIIFAIIIGILAGIMRISPIYVLRKLAVIYVEIVRGTPLLVQIFILYFFFGNIFKFSQFAAGVAALSIFTGAYIAEIFRAGVQSVPRGQTEASRSLGLSYIQTMRHVIMPQALRRTLPPMAGQFISLIKDSSLVSVIAITDLTKAGRETIAATHSVFEVWFSVALMYLILTSALSYLLSRFEMRLSKAD